VRRMVRLPLPPMVLLERQVFWPVAGVGSYEVLVVSVRAGRRT